MDFRDLFKKHGIYGGNLNYNPSGPKVAWRLQAAGRRMPREALFHSMFRGVQDFTIGENSHAGSVITNFTSMGDPIRGQYGGNIFSRSGWREITHEAIEHTPGAFKLGARRSLGSMAMKAGGKLLPLAGFAINAHFNGIGNATKDALIDGAIWGAGRWALGAIAAPALVAGGLIGGGILAREALIMGRKYNKSVRRLNMGNPFNDTYGTAATMRQASLQAIQGSKINGRNALGMEASLMHY